jgi:hypothetical protein
MMSKQTWAVESADGTAISEGLTEEQADALAESLRAAEGVECHVVDYATTDDPDERLNRDQENSSARLDGEQSAPLMWGDE